MAKTTISSADLALLRSQHHTISDIRLNIVNPSVVTTLQVSTTPTDNPASSLTVTGDMTDVKVGQRIKITDSSSNLVNWGTVRKSPSGSTLYISPVSIGDSGYVSPIRRAITATDTITVYSDYPLWGDYSRIANNTFRKQWDVTYTDQNEDAPPIANAGTSQSARVSVGGSADFTLPRLGTNSSFAFGSKTITTYAWTLPTGVSLQGGYSTSDSVIEVTATHGQHLITLVVTDSNGKTHTSYTYLFVSDGTNTLDIFDQFNASIDSDSQDADGRTITFTVHGSDIQDYLLPGAYVHLQHDSKYNGSSLTMGVDVDVFVGYIQSYQYSHNGEYGKATITAVSPYIYLKSVFMPSQLITEVSNPNKWTEVTSDLSNPRGALCYIRWQCTNLFSMHDIDANSLTTPRKYSYEYNATTISGGLDVAAHAIVGNVGSASDGTLVLRQIPTNENNTFRNALATGMTISADDVTVPLEHPVTVIPPYADIRAGAFAYDGGGVSGVKAWYGVKRWSQGSSETVLPDFTVTKSEGLDGVLEKVGHMAADAQYPDEQPISFNRNINVFDPAYMIWYALNIASTYDPKGDGWSNVRVLPKRVNRTWDTQAGTLAIQGQVKRETFGQKADQWIPGSGLTVMSGSWVADLGITFAPLLDTWSVLAAIALAYNTSGDLAITQNFTDANPTWQSLNPILTGTVCDVCWDFNSTFFSSGYLLSEPLSAYILTASSTTLYVYRLYDVKAPGLEFELVTAYTMADSTTTTEARIQCSSTNGQLVVVAWHDQTGIEFGRSNDGGSTWSSKTNVGSAGTDTDNDNASIGLYINGNNQTITGFDGTSDYDVYLATTAGGSFTKLTNSVGNTSPNAMITGDGNTTLYVSTSNDSGGGGDPADYNIDFDGSGTATMTHYSNGGSGSSSNSTTASGNPNNAGSVITSSWSTATYDGLDALISFTVATPTNIYLTFDYWHDFKGVAQSISPPSSGYIFYDVRWYSSGTPVGASTFNALETSTSSVSNGVTWTFSNAQTWTSVDHGNLSIGGSSINQIKIFVYGAYQHSVSVDSEFRIDNIKLYFDGTPGSAVNPALYKVTTYTATDTWTDISPTASYTPLTPYGLGVDIADTNNLEVMATNGTTPKYYQSANAGTSYTDNGASDYRSAKRIGDVIVYGGVSSLDLSRDAGTTVEDKTGNLDVVFNPIGTIKNVLLLS